MTLEVVTAGKQPVGFADLRTAHQVAQETRQLFFTITPRGARIMNEPAQAQRARNAFDGYGRLNAETFVLPGESANAATPPDTGSSGWLRRRGGGH